MSNLTGLIYIIRNTINEKVYIGQTTMDVRTRFRSHLKAARKNDKHTRKLYNAINKYGKDNFYYEIIEKRIPIVGLDEKEINYIKKFNSYKKGYNSTAGGDSPLIYKIEDQETILEMLQAGFYYTELAELYGVHKMTIQRLAHKLGHRQNHKITKEILLKGMKEGLTNLELAKKHNIHPRTVSRSRNKFKLRLKRKSIDKREDFNFNKLKKDWLNRKLSVDDVCIRNNVTKSVLRRFLQKHNIPNITRDSQKNWVSYIENDPSFDFKAFTIDILEKKLRINDLALKYNISKSTVVRIIKRNKLR